MRDADGETSGASAKLRARKDGRARSEARSRAAAVAAGPVHAGTGNPNFTLPPSGSTVANPTPAAKPADACLLLACFPQKLPATGPGRTPAPAKPPARAPAPPPAPKPKQPATSVPSKAGKTKPPSTPAQTRGLVGDALERANRFLKDRQKLEDARKKLAAAESKKQTEAANKRLADLAKSLADAAKRIKQIRDKVDPKTWPKTVGEANTGLRVNQLKALPKFASDLQSIGRYDQVLVQKTDQYHKVNAGTVDAVVLITYPDKSYSQLTPAERANVGRMVQSQSGALDVLLERARTAGKSATALTFGR